MVVMSTRQTSVSLLDKGKTHSVKVMGVKGDSVVATAKQVLLSDSVSEVLGGAKTMEDAVNNLGTLAIIANEDLSVVKQQVVDNAKKAKVASLIF